jgi:hypothetical protein
MKFFKNKKEVGLVATFTKKDNIKVDWFKILWGKVWTQEFKDFLVSVLLCCSSVCLFIFVSWIALLNTVNQCTSQNPCVVGEPIGDWFSLIVFVFLVSCLVTGWIYFKVKK